MTARAWRAVADLAALWRSSPYVQEYLDGCRMQLAFCPSTSGDHITAQPFYLWMYLPTVMGHSPFGRITVFTVMAGQRNAPRPGVYRNDRVAPVSPGRLPVH